MKEVKFVKANERYIPRYCSRTLFQTNENGSMEVIKKPSTGMAEDHVNQMVMASHRLKEILDKIDICACKKKEEGVCFNYIPHRTDWLKELLKAADDQKELVRKWKSFLELLTPCRSTDFVETASFVEIFGEGTSFLGTPAYPYCSIDLTPSNLLIDENGKNILIDYEWFLDFPVPIQLIMYHVVRVTVDSHPDLLKHISRMELLSELELADQIGALSRAEEHFFCHIYGDNTGNPGIPFDIAYKKGETTFYDVDFSAVEAIKFQNQQLQEAIQQEQAEKNILKDRNQHLLEKTERIAGAYESSRKQYEKLNQDYQRLSNELKYTQDQLLLAWNSKSWKITAPLRFLKRIKDEKKNPIVEVGKKIQERRLPSEKKAETEKSNNWMPSYRTEYTHKENVVSGKNARRIAIMYYYDRDGVFDRAAAKLAQGVKESVDRLVIVVGGEVNEEGKKQIGLLSDQVWYKANKGFDFWGYREGLLRVGWKQLAQFDEVILCNFTVFGPIFPLRTIYNQMSSVDCDFWGMTAHSGMDFDPFHCNPYGCIPEHIQSFFLVFRREMVKHSIFQSFWKKLPPLRDYNEAVGLAETVLTRYFEEAGFQWTTSIDRSAYYPLTDNPMLTMPLELIRDFGCTFFKKRVFFQDYDYYLSTTCGQTASQLLTYLKEKHLYDLDALWDHLLRSCHMSDLNEKLHFTKILPNHDVKQAETNLTIAAVIHLYEISMIPEIKEYCQSLPNGTDLFISTTSQKTKEEIEEAFSTLGYKTEVVVGENRGRDVSGMLVLFREKIQKYDLVCVTHDKRTSHLRPLTVGKGFAYAGYQNILSTKEYVKGIIRYFEEDPRLGILEAPLSYHADFSSQPGNEWGQNFENTWKLAQTLGLRCPMDKEHPPCAPYGSNFWFRVKALRSLLSREWAYEDFPEEPLQAVDGTMMHAIERIYPYCAQNEGYYSCVAMTDEYASLELSTLYTYANGWAGMMAGNDVVGRSVDVQQVMRMRLSNSGDRREKE